MIFSVPILFNIGCDRPGGEDEDGNSYTYGLQITSVEDHENSTPYIIFDFSTENVGTDELADVTVQNVMPSESSSLTMTYNSISTLFAYDETDSINLTAYRIDYHIEGFENIEPYIGRLNISIAATSSDTFNILLMTGATKNGIANTLNYDYKKGYITLTLSGYDGNGYEKSRSVDVDAFVYTYLRATPTPSQTATPTVTATATKTATATATATETSTP